MTVKEERAEIRSAMRDMRRRLSDAQQKEAALAAAAHVLALPAYRDARCVMAYMASRGEISLAPVIDDVLKSGRRLVLPRCEAAGVMTARHVPALSALECGMYGLLEPGAACSVAAPQEIDLILAPGTAFDRAGGRIGQGGGYYDRFLPKTRAVRAGVCHGFALLDCVPQDAHDMTMDFVITPQGVTKGNRKQQEDPR